MILEFRPFKLFGARRLQATLLSVVIAGLASCAAVRDTGPQAATPSYVSRSEVPPRIALVLSGGSVRGFAHLGVLRVLESHGLKPDLIVGCSAGSIVGALYASGLTTRAVEDSLGKMSFNLLGDVAIPGIGFLTSPLGLVHGDRIHQFVDRNSLGHAIESFPIRFAAVATDLGTGAVAIFNTGDVGLAVQASSAIPGLVAPARISGRLFSDCQISSPLPVRVARQLGAKIVIAVDVVYPPEDAGLTSSLRVAFQAFSIATYRLAQWEGAEADLVLAPVLSRTAGQFGLDDRSAIVEAGALAAEANLPRLRALFGVSEGPVR